MEYIELPEEGENLQIAFKLKKKKQKHWHRGLNEINDY